MSLPVIIMGGLGRMGATLLRLVAEDKGLELVGTVVLEEQLEEAQKLGIPVSSDVKTFLQASPTATVIDFTAPATSLAIARAVAEVGASHIIGTTGFTEEDKAELDTLATKAKIFWAPNMSVGVNTLLKILPLFASMLGEDYDMEMMEVHHNKKVDAPSGTALRIAEVLAEARREKLEDIACYQREGIIGARPHGQLGIQTLRGGDVVGDHTVYFFGQGERISITHQAHSRDNFAQGALRVAHWLTNQKTGRVYSMADVL